MSKSLIIVALALAGLHQGVFAQQFPFVGNSDIAEDVSSAILIADGGNPWAMPEQNEAYRYAEPRQQAAPRVERPRYITQEELKKLDRLPPEQNYYGPASRPLNSNRLLDDGYQRGLSPGAQGNYGQWNYPSGSYYGSPYGTSPLYDPYGGSNVLPYGGILPFLY